MAEIGAVATILQIADVGLRLSTNLFTFAETIASADKAVSSISKDVSLTSSVLRELASILQKDKGPRSYSNAAVDSAIEVVRECSGWFQEVESTLIEKLPKLSSLDPEKDKGSRLTIALERFKWPYLQPKVDLLRNNLDRLKSSLLVILNVISLAKLMKYDFFPKILKRSENEGLLARRAEPSSIDKDQTALVKDLIRSNQEYVRKYEELKHSIANTDPVSSSFLHLQANFQQGVKGILPDAEINLKHETKLEHLHYFVSLFDRLQQEASAPSYVIGLRSRSRILKHIADARSSETMHLHKIHGEAAMKKIRTKISSLPSRAHSASNSTQRVHDNGHVHTVLSEEEEYGAIESPNLHSVYQGRVTNFYWNFPQSPHGKLKPYSEHLRRRTGSSNADRAKFKDANSVDESNTSDEEKRLYYESNPSLSFNPINRWISHLPPASKYSAHFQPEEQPSKLQEQGVAKGNKEKHGVTLADLDCTDLDPALGLGGNDWNTAYDEDATINFAAINSQVCQVPQTPRQEPRPWLVNSDSENEKEDRSIWKASRSPAKREWKRVRTRLQGSVNSGIPYRDKNVCAAEKSIRETTRSVVGRASSQSIRSLRDQGPAMARDSLFMLDTGLDNMDGILIAQPIGTVPQSDWDAPDSWAVKRYNEQHAGTKGTEYFAEASANMNMGRDVPPEYEASKKHSAKSDIRAATEHKYEMSAGYGSSYQCTPPSDVADLAQHHYSSKPTPQGLSIPQQVRVDYRPNQPTQNQLQFQAWKEHESKQYAGSANMSRKSPSVAAHLYQSLEGNGKLQEAVTWSDSAKHTEKYEAEKHVSHEPSEFTHKWSVSPQKSIDHQFNLQKSQRLREEDLDLSARSSSNLDMSLDDMEGFSNNEQRNQVSTGARFADLKAPETFEIEQFGKNALGDIIEEETGGNKDPADVMAEIEAKEREEKEWEKKYKKILNEDLKRVGNEAKQVKAAWHAEGVDGDEKARKKYSKSFSTLKKDILRNSTGDNSMASKGEPTKTTRTTPSVKVKPAALKLETIKPTEPSLPSAQLQSLMTARQLRNINDSTYPSGTMPPRAKLNNDAAPFESRYDRNFLLQFSEAFVAKPSLDWDARLQRVMGTKASAISRKDNSLYEGYGGYETLDTFRPLKDNVQIFSTHSRGETTDLDRIIGDEDPFVAKAHARSLNGSFHRMTPPVCDRATDGDEPFLKHDVPPMPMRSEIQGSDLTRVSSLSEPCERALATASEQQRKTIRIRGFGGNRPSRPAKKLRDLDTHTLISADIKEGDITGRSELDEDAENSGCITKNFLSDNNPIDPDFSPQRDKGGYRTGQQRLEELLKLWTPLDDIGIDPQK